MNPSKLDETIKEFESEVVKLKSANDMYAEIENIYKEIIYNADLYDNNNKEILDIKVQLESSLLNYKEFQDKLIGINNSMKDSNEKELAAIRAQNVELNKSILENIDKLDEAYDKKVLDMRRENREAYEELEKLLSSKLERIKSDIEVSIRDGNVSTERIIGNQFDLKFVQFNELTSRKFEQIEKKFSGLFMFLGGIFVALIISIVINFMHK